MLQMAADNIVDPGTAKKTAAEFLSAQMKISEAVHAADFDARKAKIKLKAVKARVYMEAVSGADKKPTEAMLVAIVDSNQEVVDAQIEFDGFEVDCDLLGHYLHTMQESHVYFRSLMGA
jgi:hypothetical protein